MSEEIKDNWGDRVTGMVCNTCVSFVPKKSWSDSEIVDSKKGCMGRCRKHAPTLNGWPVVFASDWCGDHKLK